MRRPDISPLYAELLACSPSSASVEQSFFMLKSMICKNRSFVYAKVAFEIALQRLTILLVILCIKQSNFILLIFK